MTNTERLHMIRAAHRRALRANRYADHVAVTARDDHDVPCIGRAHVEIAPVTVATREPWGVR
jgi:hypothetical protein